MLYRHMSYTQILLCTICILIDLGMDFITLSKYVEMKIDNQHHITSFMAGLLLLDLIICQILHITSSNNNHNESLFWTMSEFILGMGLLIVVDKRFLKIILNNGQLSDEKFFIALLLNGIQYGLSIVESKTNYWLFMECTS